MGLASLILDANRPGMGLGLVAIAGLGGNIYSVCTCTDGGLHAYSDHYF